MKNAAVGMVLLTLSPSLSLSSSHSLSTLPSSPSPLFTLVSIVCQDLQIALDAVYMLTCPLRDADVCTDAMFHSEGRSKAALQRLW